MRSKGTAVDRYAARGMIRIPSAGTIVVRGTPSPEDHGATLPCDSYGQTVSALRAIVDAVARAGATMHDIVSTRISVSDPAAWTSVGRAHAEFFRGIDPVATLVDAVRDLDPRTIVEIEAYAVAGGTPRKPACERCGAGVTGDPGAANCGWNCTFCGACSAAMAHRCPNCGGELVTRIPR